MIKSILKLLAGWFKPPSKPEITFYEVDSASVINEITGMKVSIPFGMQDNIYYYTTEWGWRQAVDYVRKVYNFPPYEAEVRDCDFFALLMKALVEHHFGLTTCGYTNGMSPLGSHAFNKVRTDTGWKDLEPQTGKFVENYVSNKVLL